MAESTARVTLRGTFENGGPTIECGSGRIVAGSCNMITNMGTVRFFHATYQDNTLTANMIYSTKAVTGSSANHITVLDPNMNALSGDFCYMALGF